MAEDSAFWPGTAIGDAASSTIWNAPYTDAEYSDIWSKFMASDSNRGFVVGGFGNNLQVYENTPNAMSVLVATGAIFIKGRLYENTAVNTLTITTNTSGNPRLDRIIIRVNVPAQTIRAFVLTGTPAANPTLPALTQTATTFEISLGYIWVATGTSTIVDEDIHDEREFICASANYNDSANFPNLVRNSEFMGFSSLSGGATTGAPDFWDLVLTPSDVASYTKPAQMARGRAIQITTNAASEGISQTAYVKASTTYSIRLLGRVTAGDVGSVVVTTNSAAPGTVTRYIRRTATWVEERIVYTTEADATQITVKLLGLNNGDIIQYGQVLLIEGYVPGPFRQFSEVITFIEPITDANWNNTAKSTANTTITLTADFQALILLGTKNIFVTIKARDSGSAAGTPTFFIQPYASGGVGVWVGLYLEGVGNDKYRGNQGIIALDTALRFYANVTASGVGTCDCTITIVGITT